MQMAAFFQKILEEITNADTGAPCSPQHIKKVNKFEYYEFLIS